MSLLKSRIVAQAPASNLREVGMNNAPSQLPATRLEMTPGTLSYSELSYGIATDGAPFIGVPVGGFGTLARAGRA